MDKIYIVTSGEYSDYGIRAIFSTREMADKFKELKGNISNIQVEVFPVDKFEDTTRKNLAPWEIWIRKNGEIHPLYGDNPKHVEEFEEGIKFFKPEIYYVKELQEGFLAVKCLASDEQHACKIAKEKWAVFIALGMWEEAKE